MKRESIAEYCGKRGAQGVCLSLIRFSSGKLGLSSAEKSDAARYLDANVGAMELFASSARGGFLNAKERKSALSGRMYAWAGTLLKEGHTSVSAEEILDSLRALDKREMLNTREIEYAPDVLKLRAAEEFLYASFDALRIQRERKKAERWMENPKVFPAGCDGVSFLEHALRMCMEEDAEDAKRELLRRLSLSGRTEEECVNAAQNEESDARVRMENCVSVCRTLDGMNWEKAFEDVSFTEKTLKRDPSGVYGRMEDDSKRAILRENAVIAEKTGHPERVCASLAVEEAENYPDSGVCGVLYTDQGRKALLRKLNAENARVPSVCPDPSGRRMTAIIIGAFLVLYCLSAVFVRSFAVSIVAFPAVWTLSLSVLRAIFSRKTRPKPLLKMEMSTVPDEAATLAVIPALIPNANRVFPLVRQLEAMGALNTQKNVEFLLLGDFADSREASQPEDRAILESVRKEIARMNGRAGRTKYHYLHRNRVYNANDEIWMGYERKRGALNDLNALLLSGENRFGAESACAEKLKNRFRYVVTVDADTQMIPGTIEKLIGTIHHPLNRPRSDGSGYAVIQPRMERMPSADGNRFSRLMGGVGGADNYHSCASEMLQDYCGRGVYNGKGIYEAKAFSERCEGVFRENSLLSHDMMEGIVAGAGYAGDISLFEGFPSGPASYLKRQERWTRGDWQLLSLFFGRIKLAAIDRLRILDNLIRSLTDTSLCALFILAVWENRPQAALLALVTLFLPCLWGKLDAAKAAAGRTLLLPSLMAVNQGALGRALYRMLFSHRRMLEWVTAAEAEALTGGKNTAGIAQTILLLPAFARPGWIPYALIMGAVFTFGRLALERLSQNDRKGQLTTKEFGCLLETARSTWKYFERFVPLDGNGLPPDNVQLEPAKNAAERTSLTNIGMYLVSCEAAAEMGIICGQERQARVSKTLKTLLTLEQWNGLLYNWYDTKTEKPLSPRYVSSVDCGNLLAALVLIRNAEEDARILEMLNGLIEGMNLEKLYDPARNLFYVGYDAERDCPGNAHYDLMASETRILSYVAMAEKGIPVRHWEALGRPCARVNGKSALISWSGTMFEYMMPFLFMPSAPGTLLSQSAKAAVEAQIRYAMGKDRPWGVSECAYRAFDHEMNYQYRAFGVPELAVSGENEGNVIAPYATLLALAAEPRRAAENLMRMNETDLRGEMGLYEAEDYENGRNVVYVYMTHHQGMALCAICNAVTGNRLNEMFMSGAKENALRVLLNEKPFAKPRLWKRSNPLWQFSGESAENACFSYLRTVQEPDSEKAQLLFGKETCAFLAADGSGCMRRNGVYANLWHGDPRRYQERILPEFWEDERKIEIRRAEFDAGTCVFWGESENARYEIRSCVSPENGAWIFEAKIIAKEKTVSVRCRQSFAVALCDEEAMLSHPAFQGLFVVPEKNAPGVWRFSRRKRLKSDTDLVLYHAASGGETANRTDRRGKREPVPPREGGRPLRQDALLEMETKVPENETAKLYFALQIAEKDEEFRTDLLTEAEFDRAMALSAARARTLLDFYGIHGTVYRSMMRYAAFLFIAGRTETDDFVRLTGRELWKYGISGKNPILLAFVLNEGQAESAKALVREHGYLNACGAFVETVIAYEAENGYFQPLRDRLRGMIAASPFHDRIRLVERKNLSREEAAALRALAINGKHAKLPKEKEPCFLPMKDELQKTERIADCGLGGFTADGFGYEISVLPGFDTPAPWINILANPSFGALITERGGGFLWHGNSRMERLTPFDNDPIFEGFGIRLYAENQNGKIPLTPGSEARGAYRVVHRAWETLFECAAEEREFLTEWWADAEESVLCVRVCSEISDEWRWNARADWLMGEDVRDRRFLRTEWKNGMLLAKGKMNGVAFLTAVGETAAYEDGFVKAGLASPVLIGWAKDERDAERIRASFQAEASLERTRQVWIDRLTRTEADTGDIPANAVVNRFCKMQALSCRMFARTGLYQPGGAFGLRDQLQDLLCVLYMDAEIARKHILNAASHQFEDGDGMHWWHEPRTGVRTRVSDDVAFLPYVCAKYVRETGDKEILNEKIAYLKNEEIAEDSEDWYGEGRVSEQIGSLHEHCMKAFRYAGRTGAHGLTLMGACDWNDGMNRIGARGKGESVWLSEFLSCAAREYADVCEESDRAYLLDLSNRLTKAVDEYGWDGEWYLRAYDDEGLPVGSAQSDECKIDLITQAWAAINGQNPERTEKALEGAEKWLRDSRHSLIKLLAPPFTGRKYDPGYLASYPEGVRENGGQYTHAAAWLAMAYARTGNARKAWEIFRMLLPLDRTDTLEKALYYRAEPYALAADICSSDGCAGVAGWTWYTGSAAWAVRVLYEEILGLKIRGNYAQMRALLPENKQEMSITVRKGKTVYHFFSGRYGDSRKLETAPIEMKDDGQEHMYYFPAR